MSLVQGFKYIYQKYLILLAGNFSKVCLAKHNLQEKEKQNESAKK